MAAKDWILMLFASLVIAGCSSCSGGSGSSAPTATAPTPPANPTPPAPAGTTFPLHIDAGHRYLITASGEPYFLQGDAAWSLIARLTREQITQYLDDRQARGFNAIIVELIEHKFSDNPPNNAYGDPPFLTPNDFTTPNEKYFQHAAYAIGEAARRGMVVLLAPAYLGIDGGDEGWYAAMTDQGTTRLKQYGRYVGTRFKDYTNIVWVHGGDFNPPEGRSFRAVAEGIVEIEPAALHTFHGARNSSAFGVISPQDPWLRLNNIYTSDDNIVSSAFTEYSRATAPFFLIEAVYDQRGVDANGVRREAYQAILSGASGHVIGHDLVWQFAPGWQNALDTSATRSIAPMQALMSLLHWPALEPDTQAALIVSGGGTAADKVAASIAPDGTVAVLYVPNRRNVTANFARMPSAQVRLRWFNPVTGALTEMPGSPVARSAAQLLSPPTDASAPDWVAVAEAVQ